MATDAPALAATTLREAVHRTFPERPEVVALQFAGPEAQAWNAYARVLPLRCQERIGRLRSRTFADPRQRKRFTRALLGISPPHYAATSGKSHKKRHPADGLGGPLVKRDAGTFASVSCWLL